MTAPRPESTQPSAPRTDDRIPVLDHGFVRLDAMMADDLSVANAARVSFARRKDVMDDADRGLIRFLMRDRHGTPFEHNAFRFHVRCPIFVAREWFRHRIGCLTGDTVVTFVNTYGSAVATLSRTMAELWAAWMIGERDGHVLDLRDSGGWRDGRWRIKRMNLRVLDEHTNEFTVGHIEGVVDKGVQPVYRVTLADGKSLTMTENHRILTVDGWRTMREAVGLVGDGDGASMTRRTALITNGSPACQDAELEFARRAADKVGFVVDLPVPDRRGWKLTGHPIDVLSVAYVGLRQTFDLIVGGPWHNFVANGVVVHNSFNEFSMRYAKATDEFYVPQAEDVRSQVGKPGAYSFEPVDDELAGFTRHELERIYDQAYAAYTGLVERGVARELARTVLPVGAYTEFYWTVNARALMNFLSLRNAETAQREIRMYAKACETFLERHMPVTYEAFLANGRNAP